MLIFDIIWNKMLRRVLLQQRDVTGYSINERWIFHKNEIINNPITASVAAKEIIEKKLIRTKISFFLQ